MRLVGLLQITGYEWKPSDRTFHLSGLTFQPPRFPCEPRGILEPGSSVCGLGHVILLPVSGKTGKLIPILGSGSNSASIIVDFKLLRGSKETIGAQELDPLKGLIVQIFQVETFDYGTYESYLKQSHPYLQKLEDATESPEYPLERFLKVR